jgi:chaperonin cofactor prefoldin
MTNLLRFDFNDRDGVFEVIENGDWVRATDYDALVAKLAKAEEMLEREIRRVQKIQRDLPPPHNVGLVYVEAEYKLMLAELKGQEERTND